MSCYTTNPHTLVTSAHAELEEEVPVTDWPGPHSAAGLCPKARLGWQS